MRYPWLRRLLVIVAFVPLAAGLVLFNVWAFLRSSWGASVLAGQVEMRVSEGVLGTVRIGQIGTFGAFGFRLEHVFVVDPEGDPVIAVRDLRVKLDPWWLIIGRAVVDIRIDDGRMALVPLPQYDDVNVGAAFRPRVPKPPAPPRGPRAKRTEPEPPLPPDPPVAIVLRSLRIDDTAFVLLPAWGEPPQALVRDIAIRAAGRWDDRGASTDLTLEAQTLLPVQAPLELDVGSAFAQNWLDALRVNLRLGDTALEVRGRGEMRALQGRIVADGTLGAAELAGLGIPAASDISLTTDIWLAMDRSSLALRLGAGEGVAAIDGWYQRDEKRLFAQAILAEIDPSAWMQGAPRGTLSGSVRGAGLVAPSVDMQLSVDLQPGRLLGRSVGPVALAARLDGERLVFDRSTVALPGANVRIEGSASGEALDLRGRVAARDLAESAAFVGELLGEPPLPVAGRGAVTFGVGGTPDAPHVSAQLEFPRLAWAGTDARAVEIDATVRMPAEGLPAGSLHGTIGRLRTQRLDARDLRLDAKRTGAGDFSIDLKAQSSLAGSADLGATALRAQGNVQSESARIDRFEFRYPEGALRSEQQATVRFGDGAYTVEGLELRQRGNGALALRGGVVGGRLDLEARGENLRLDRLPQALLPESLAGTVDLDAQLRGSTQAPDGKVRFRLRDGAYGALRDLAGSGDVRLHEGRAAGQVEMALGGAGLVQGTFDGPLDFMNAPAREPFDVDLRVGPLDLAGLGRALGQELPEARVRGRVVGHGRLGEPDLDLDLLVSRVELPDAPDLPALSAQIRGTLHEGDAVLEMEAWAADARLLELRALVPLDPRRLRNEPGEEMRRMLESASSHARGVVRGLDLAVVGALIDQPDLRGAMVADFDVQGPIVDPRGVVRLEARGGPVGPIRRLSFATLVELLPERSRLVAGIALDDQPPAEIRTSVEAPPRAFLAGTAAPDTPAELVIDVPRLELGLIGPRAATQAARGLVTGTNQADRRLAGTVHARGHFSGTLANLPGELRIVAQDLVVRGVPLGGAELALEQREGLSAWLAAIDPNAGTLTARARLDGTLSPLGLAQQGVAFLRDARAEVSAEGIGLTLAPLALVSSINRASGSLDFQARAQGPLRDLDPVGRVEVRNGTVELVGGPRYQDIRLDARLTGERMVLAKLQAAAPGRGSLTADGRLERVVGPNPFAFALRANAFPIGGPGGVSARVSGEGRFEGTFGTSEGLIAELTVPHARIFLPRTPPRDLQSVSRLDDVVIVTGPEAYLRQKQQQRAESETALPMVVEVDAQRVFVRGADVDAQLSADLTVRRIETGELVANGAVRTRRGNVRALGRSFELEEAAAIWGGGPVDNPQLAITARYQARDATAWVDVGGPASAPQITLRSDPPLPESQIALLIAAGRTELPGQASPFDEEPATTEIDAAGAAVSVAGSFAAQRLKQAVGPRLPLDVLTLETAGEGTRLEAGTYVSDRLYLGYLRNFLPDEGENANEVRAEYELSRTVSIESRVGDRGAAGVDLVWEKQIATPAQQRARQQVREERAARRQVEPGRDQPAGFQPGDRE